jgi:hypothetical protein
MVYLREYNAYTVPHAGASITEMEYETDLDSDKFRCFDQLQRSTRQRRDEYCFRILDRSIVVSCAMMHVGKWDVCYI